MSYEQIKDLPPPEFKRLCGVHIATFRRMVEVLKPGLVRTGKKGGQPKLSVDGADLPSHERHHNRQLAQLRVVGEHINRRLKIFRILKEEYRNRRKRFGLRCNLIAGLLNYELALFS